MDKFADLYTKMTAYSH